MPGVASRTKSLSRSGSTCFPYAIILETYPSGQTWADIELSLRNSTLAISLQWPPHFHATLSKVCETVSISSFGMRTNLLEQAALKQIADGPLCQVHALGVSGQDMAHLSVRHLHEDL